MLPYTISTIPPVLYLGEEGESARRKVSDDFDFSDLFKQRTAGRTQELVSTVVVVVVA
jgi:hypothetical protein